MQTVISLSRGIDPATGKGWILCPLCFDTNDLISAREGGRLSTDEDGTMSDVCVDCDATEYLYEANLMNA